MEELYVGMDLHSRNTYTGIMTKDFKRVFGKRLIKGSDLLLALIIFCKGQE